MYLIAMGWLYVALMMAVAESMHPNGGVLGAVITFVLYGLLPVALLVYLMGAPLRRKKLKAQEMLDGHETPSGQPNTGSESPANTPVASVRKEL
jgi:hypothetical protein